MKSFNKKLLHLVFAIPVLLVNLITISNVLILHLALLPLDYSSKSLILTISIDFCIITGMLSYFRAFLSDPGSIPFDFDLLSENYKEKLSEDEYGPDRKFVSVSFCFKCERDRPARAHHCVICDKCILRMDHHCPWVGNCVGIMNLKFFMQFIFYAMITTSYISGRCGRLIIEGNESFIVNGGFLLSLGLFVMLWMLIVYHVWMTVVNTNTIEMTFYRGKNNFDFGWRRNLAEVFGNDWKMWIFPVSLPRRKGLGYEYPVKIVNKQGETVYFHEKVLFN
jgi:palmitoyltransferase